jgi:hypothetical protein
MTSKQIKEIADRLAASNCTRILCGTAAQEIAAALHNAYAEGFEAGQRVTAEGKIKSGAPGARSFPESLERVDWSGVIKASVL